MCKTSPPIVHLCFCTQKMYKFTTPIVQLWGEGNCAFAPKTCTNLPPIVQLCFCTQKMYNFSIYCITVLRYSKMYKFTSWYLILLLTWTNLCTNTSRWIFSYYLGKRCKGIRRSPVLRLVQFLLYSQETIKCCAGALQNLQTMKYFAIINTYIHNIYTHRIFVEWPYLHNYSFAYAHQGHLVILQKERKRRRKTFGIP
mgnify:CR=1 FL=1